MTRTMAGCLSRNARLVALLRASAADEMKPQAVSVAGKPA